CTRPPTDRRRWRCRPRPFPPRVRHRCWVAGARPPKRSTTMPTPEPRAPFAPPGAPSPGTSVGVGAGAAVAGDLAGLALVAVAIDHAALAGIVRVRRRTRRQKQQQQEGPQNRTAALTPPPCADTAGASTN